MSFLAMILSVGVLAATGIYNPAVVINGQCIAEPGTFDALYCPSLAPKLKPAQTIIIIRKGLK